jgi:hypothetical protein
VSSGGLADLRRWIDSGGVWELVEVDADRAVVALITCTGGEVVGTLDSRDPDLLAFVTLRGT